MTEPLESKYFLHQSRLSNGMTNDSLLIRVQCFIVVVAVLWSSGMNSSVESHGIETRKHTQLKFGISFFFPRSPHISSPLFT